MANDRIYIRCKSCDERLMLTKHYPTFPLGELAKTPNELAEFISKHLNHHPNLSLGNLGEDPGLVFETELEMEKQ